MAVIELLNSREEFAVGLEEVHGRQVEQKAFSPIELLIVVAIILVIAAIAIPNLLRSRIAVNQASAIGSLRTIDTAEASCSSTFNVGYSSTPLQLAPPAAGKPASTSAAGLLDSVMVSGVKSGYNFTYAPQAPDVQGKYTGYTVNADPSQVGVTGTAHYYADQTYVIRGNNTDVASASSWPAAN